MSSNPKISVGGKEYEVKYIFGTFVAMHEKHGVNVFSMENPTPRMVAILIWGAIIHVEPMITPDEIILKLSMEEAVKGNNVCTQAIINCLPKRETVSDSA